MLTNLIRRLLGRSPTPGKPGAPDGAPGRSKVLRAYQLSAFDDDKGVARRLGVNQGKARRMIRRGRNISGKTK